MDNIVDCIFKSCDTKNSNLVQVSSLIEYIKPYMSNNLSELEELQKHLDPEDTNPFIDSSSFQRVMSDWIANIQEADSFSEFSVNLGNSLSSSFGGDSKPINNNIIEDVNLSEEVKNLKLQLNKATNELELVKKQLIVYEEENESLLVNLNSCRKNQIKEQIVNDHFNEMQSERQEMEEQKDVITKKYEQMEKMLAIYEKDQEKYFSQIKELENENETLKNKLQTFEKVKREGRKSISDLQDCVDEKDAEISTLMEVIENLKSQVEEKNDLLNFYTKEHKLLKQRTHDLENLLQNATIQQKDESTISKFSFNTPKLLNQIANPISPSLSPSFLTSSPLKNNTSLENSNDSYFNIFSKTDVEIMIRSPHKTLQEELAEISKESNDLETLHKAMKDQEEIKNNLWQHMKQLADENNKAILDYKKINTDLILEIDQKNQIIKNMEVEMKNTKQKFDDMALTIEKNLEKQKVLNVDLGNKLKVVGITLEKTDVMSRILKARKEKLKRVKNTSDQGSQTEDGINWNIKEFSDCVAPKQGNFGKQQIKIERMLEKQEKLQRELSTEKNINTKVTMKNQQLSDELIEKTRRLDHLTIENRALLSKVDKVNTEMGDLHSEIVKLKDEVTSLRLAKTSLEENLSREQITSTNLQMENDLLLNKQYQMETKIQQEINHQFNLTKQLIDLRVIYSNSIKQLQKELIEKSTEIRTLKKQFEDINIEFFLCSCNEELHRALLNISDCFNFDEDANLINPSEYDYSFFSLENEMTKLSVNVNLVVSLSQKICDRFFNSLQDKSKEISVSCNLDEEWYDETFASNEEHFLSCVSELSFTNEGVPEIVSLETDSFLENLKLDTVDLRLSSLEKMQEIFTTLALHLTIDITSLRKRNVNDRDKFNQLTMKFFSYLNYNLYLLNKLKVSEKHKIFKSISTHLELMKDLVQDLLQASFSCGVLHYENKTLNFWKFILNYVAVLTQENKQMKEIQNTRGSNLQIKNLPLICVSFGQKPTSHNWSGLSIKFWFCFVIFLLFLIVLLVVFYIDYLCSKNVNRMCPLQWITDLLIVKKYSHNL